MSESLLSFSEVLLFGRKVEDLRIANKEGDADQADHRVTVTTTRRVHGGLAGHKVIDGVFVKNTMKVLVRHHGANDNGIYTVGAASAEWTKIDPLLGKGETVFVEEGDRLARSIWRQKLQQTDKQQFVHVGGPGRGQGRNSELDDQLGEGACLARIYGFSYEGTYYELPTPALFLVHGEGTNAAEFGGEENQPDDLAARAPNNPSLSGVAAADFQFANDIRVWAYDKGDYSIRMDVMSGQLEEILLNIFFEVDLPAIRGAMVGGAGGPKGAMVSGAKVRGAMVRGAMVRGAMVGGNRNRD